MENKSKFKAIFYDSKATLFDWYPIWVEASKRVIDKYDCKVDADEFMDLWHKFLVMVNHRVAFGQYQEFTESLQESLIYVSRYYGIPSVDSGDVHFLTDLWDIVQPFSDAHIALAEQQSKTKVFIFSNVETKYLKMMASKVENFKPDFMSTMEEARMCKPSPRAYYWVLKQNNLELKDVLYCARPQWDVQGAIALGMKTAWLNRTGEKVAGIKYDYEVKDLHGITGLL